MYAASYNVPFATDLVHHLQQIIIVAAILSVTFFASRLSVGIVSQYSKTKTGDQSSTSIFVNITRVLVVSIGILIVLQSLGISITPIITALGVGGLAVALALQDTLSNFFAGLQILISKQIRPGDYIQLDTGEEGNISDINWRNTSVKTQVNNVVVIPNSKLASAKVTNFHLPDHEMSIPVTISVSYDSDLNRIEKVCLDAAKKFQDEHPSGSRTFEPVVRFHTFDASGIAFNVTVRTSEIADRFKLKSDFIKVLHKRMQEEKIEIPYPVRSVIIKNK